MFKSDKTASDIYHHMLPKKRMKNGLQEKGEPIIFKG